MSQPITRRRFLVAGASVLAAGAAALVGGTYAKYVTSDSKEDKARAAKFGVVVKADGDLFGKTYVSALDTTYGNKPAADSYTGTLTVVSSGDYSVVAPGTRNDEGLTLSFSGKPEVAVQVTATAEGKDVFLKAGTYADATGAPGDDGVYATAAYADYYPVKYTLTWSERTDPLVDKGSLETLLLYINKTLSGELNNAIAAAGGVSKADLAEALGTLTLTWEWAFAETDAENRADTLLGALAAGLAGVAVDAGSYNLEPEIKVAVTVAQVD
jgi:hypothetical protein